MFHARSRAPRSVPLPFLRRRHPLLALLVRWPRFRTWLTRNPRHGLARG